MFLFSNEHRPLPNINYDSQQVVDGLRLKHDYTTVVPKLSTRGPVIVRLCKMSDILKLTSIYLCNT